jgi:hypothetical protein
MEWRYSCVPCPLYPWGMNTWYPLETWRKREKNSYPCQESNPSSADHSLVTILILPASEAEIKSIILSLKSKNSSGYCEIMSKILKACVSLISQPFSHIYNHSLNRGFL